MRWFDRVCRAMSSRPRAVMLGLYALALLLRILYWREYGSAPLGYLDADGLTYFRNAQWLSVHWSELLTSYQWHRWGGWIKAPLYYVFLAGVARLVDYLPLGIRLVQVLIDAGTAVLVFGLTRELFGFRAGVVAGVAYAVYYEFVILPCQLVTETWFLFTFTAFLWVVHRASARSSMRLFAGSGFLAGITALFRPIILPFMPVVAGWALIEQRRSTGQWRRPILLVLVLTVATSLPTVPWMVRNSVLIGRPFGIDNMAGLNVMLSHPFPELDEYRMGPDAYLTNRRLYRHVIWNWPSFRRGVPLSAGRMLEVIFEPSVRNMRMIVNKTQQILRPKLTRLYYNLPPEKRYPLVPPSPAVAIGSDVLFLLGSILALIGLALAANRRNVLLVLWIAMQLFFLTVVFRPTPNYHMRRYSLTFMLAALPFIPAGLAAARRHASATRTVATAVLLGLWMLVIVPPMVRWMAGREIWVYKGLEIVLED